MKRFVALVSSIVAFASSAAFAPSYQRQDPPFMTEVSSSEKDAGSLGSPSSNEKDGFAPRFDGLRFIETLVTAHR
ncbi:hypothetical protein MRB53_019500 [Persea americana]|uniref:Uncharacterized protein n=1 Tax=Persea americana TaxID=3435 RepID=A0ACC2KYJ1_PERAE|nr:hypothetical protein MRB53_019500 [Persea americana]